MGRGEKGRGGRREERGGRGGEKRGKRGERKEERERRRQVREKERGERKNKMYQAFYLYSRILYTSHTIPQTGGQTNPTNTNTITSQTGYLQDSNYLGFSILSNYSRWPLKADYIVQHYTSTTDLYRIIFSDYQLSYMVELETWWLVVFQLPQRRSFFYSRQYCHPQAKFIPVNWIS